MSNFALAGGTLVERKIGLRDDADATTEMVHHRNAAHLRLGHNALYAVHVVIRAAALRVSGHGFLNPGVRTLVLRCAATRDVTVRDDSDQPVSLFVLDYGNAPAVVLPHQPGRITDGLIRRTAGWLCGHQLSSFHFILQRSFRLILPIRRHHHSAHAAALD
jgi:hypothetical protein